MPSRQAVGDDTTSSSAPLVPVTRSNLVTELYETSSNRRSIFSVLRERAGAASPAVTQSSDIFVGSARPLQAFWSDYGNMALSLEKCEFLEATKTGYTAPPLRLSRKTDIKNDANMREGTEGAEGLKIKNLISASKPLYRSGRLNDESLLDAPELEELDETFRCVVSGGNVPVLDARALDVHVADREK